MDSLQKIIDEIGLNEYINAVLVQNDGRPAFMIQPSDYNEKKKTDKITLKKLENIKKYFPDLYQLKTGWGIIISKKKLNSKSITNDKDVGKVLGYPCYKDFSREQNENEQLITYDIIIKLKNKRGLIGYSTHIILFSDVCKDTISYKEHLEMKNKIESILKKDDIIGKLLDSVLLNEDTNIPPGHIILTLQNNKKITENEKGDIIHYIYNMGFSDKIQKIIRNMDINTSFNRGVITTLLAYYIDNPLEPFYPLQNHPENPLVVKKLEDLEKRLITLLTNKKSKTLKKKKKSNKSTSRHKKI